MCIGEPGPSEWAYDYAVKEVRDENLAVIREVLEDYEADGIELDFMFGSQYFKSDALDEGAEDDERLRGGSSRAGGSDRSEAGPRGRRHGPYRPTS